MATPANLFNYIQGTDVDRQQHDFIPKLKGNRVTQDKILTTVETEWQSAIVRKLVHTTTADPNGTAATGTPPIPATNADSTTTTPTADPSAMQKEAVWYFFVEHRIQIAAHPGFSQANGAQVGSEIRLGKIEIRVSHDSETQPPKKDGKELLEAQITHSGPPATIQSADKSWSVSESISGSVGWFGKDFTASVSASYDWSKTYSTRVSDVTVQEYYEDNNQSHVWIFDFNGMESLASQSTFEMPVQTIWRYEKKADTLHKLDSTAIKLKIKWIPHAWFTTGTQRFNEGDCAPMEFELKLGLGASDIPGEDQIKIA